MNEEQVILYHSGELSSEEAEAVRMELEQNTELREFYESLIEQEQFFSAALQHDVQAPDLTDQVMKELTSKENSDKKVISYWKPALLAMAACVAIGAVVISIQPTKPVVNQTAAGGADGGADIPKPIRIAPTILERSDRIARVNTLLYDRSYSSRRQPSKFSKMLSRVRNKKDRTQIN